MSNEGNQPLVEFRRSQARKATLVLTRELVVSLQVVSNGRLESRQSSITIDL